MRGCHGNAPRLCPFYLLTRIASTTTTFAYNGNGLRDSLTTGGNTTTFTWDLGSAQLLDDGALKYPFDFAQGRLNGLGRIAQVGSSGATYYYLPDGLGSTMALCDASGNVVIAYNYDAFGAIRSSAGSQANDFKFTGEQSDSSTGLEYLRARYYDPAAGSFISRDSYGGSAKQPLSQNRFAYAEANPVNKTDPSGHCTSAAAMERIKKSRPKFRSGRIGEIWQEAWDKAEQIPVCGESTNAATPTATPTPHTTGANRDGVRRLETCIGVSRECVDSNLYILRELENVSRIESRKQEYCEAAYQEYEKSQHPNAPAKTGAPSDPYADAIAVAIADINERNAEKNLRRGQCPYR